eukprot:s5844_g4.t2
MPSLEACKKHLDTESEMQFEDHMYEFVCSCKEISEYKGEALRQWIDVYVVSLKNPPELHKIFYDIKEATELKYIGVGELEQAYQSQDPSFVRVAAPEYARRLFHFLHKKIRVYLDMLPKVDSDEERHNKKGQQLLDRIGDVSMLSRAQDLNVIVDPCRRNEAYNESVWHRAVHVWVFDIEGGRFLIQQRSPKKRHFGGKWNCSTGHIKMGDPALPTAMKSVKDDVGIQDVEEADFEYLFQVFLFNLCRWQGSNSVVSSWPAISGMNEARAMLDALMGPQRDIRKKGKHLSDDWKDKTAMVLAGMLWGTRRPAHVFHFIVKSCALTGPMPACGHPRRFSCKAVLGGIQKRDLKVCPKIHSDIIRDRFLQHADGAEQSEIRLEYEDECFSQCEEILAEFESFGQQELERLKDDPRRHALPEDVKEKLKGMKDEAAFNLKRAEDLDAMALTTGGYNNMSSTLRRQVRELNAEAESLRRLELRKAAEKLKPQVCEVCGTGYLDQEEFEAHLNFRVHEGYKQVRDKFEALEKKRVQRPHKSKARTSSQPSTTRDAPKQDHRKTPELEEGFRPAAERHKADADQEEKPKPRQISHVDNIVDANDRRKRRRRTTSRSRYDRRDSGLPQKVVVVVVVVVAAAAAGVGVVVVVVAGVIVVVVVLAAVAAVTVVVAVAVAAAAVCRCYLPLLFVAVAVAVAVVVNLFVVVGGVVVVG